MDSFMTFCNVICCIEEFHETTTHVILATLKYGHGNQSDCKYLCSTTLYSTKLWQGKTLANFNEFTKVLLCQITSKFIQQA